ncbi:MAG: hypothetical protein GX910_06660 [Clostridiaceae bacterium]|jgi:predicted MPP superfamily phosphohydrolase|nr:hypothetical protein [Clostridiaceae bacterium]
MNMWPILFSIIGAIGVLCLLYGFFIEPKFIRQRHVTVTLPAPRVTHLTKPLKVVFFSDIHIGPRTTKDKLDRQMRAIMRNKPDAIIFGGDLVEEATPLADEAVQSMTISALASLEAPLGKWAVFGNHDLEAPRFRRWTEKVLHASGFKILENEGACLEELPLWGFEDALHGTPSRDTNNGLRHNCFEINDISGCISSEKTLSRHTDPLSPFTLYISHEPDTALLYQDEEVTGLMLSGHSHYGQVTLFGLPLIRVPAAKHFVKGHYDVQSDLKLIISAGLGTVHIHARFFARPDIVTVLFQPSTKATDIAYSFK